MSKEVLELKGRTEGPNVFQRIQNVMADIGVISKNGKNAFQNYQYATEADYVKTIQPLLVKHGLALTLVQQNILGVIAVNDKEGPNGKFLTTILSTYRIVNVSKPEDYVTVQAGGQGIDNGDKGIYKAITGAKKYALANAFLIATGDDPEQDVLTSHRKVAGPAKIASAEF